MPARLVVECAPAAGTPAVRTVEVPPLTEQSRQALATTNLKQFAQQNGIAAQLVYWRLRAS